jgi:hypothetical protein
MLNIYGPHYRPGSYGKNAVTSKLVLNKQAFGGSPLKFHSPFFTVVLLLKISVTCGQAWSKILIFVLTPFITVFVTIVLCYH